MFRSIFAFVAAVSLTACATSYQPRPPGGVAPPSSDPCGALQMQNAIGYPINEVRPYVPNARIIYPGQAVTMDYRADRLNVEVDRNGIVTSIKCG